MFEKTLVFENQIQQSKLFASGNAFQREHVGVGERTAAVVVLFENSELFTAFWRIFECRKLFLFAWQAAVNVNTLERRQKSISSLQGPRKKAHILSDLYS